MGKSSVREKNWECWGTVNLGLQNGVCTTDEVGFELTRR